MYEGAEHPTGRRPRVAGCKVTLDETKKSGCFQALRGIWFFIWVVRRLSDTGVNHRRILDEADLLFGDISENILANEGSGREMEIRLPLGFIWIVPYVTQHRRSCSMSLE